MKPFSVALCLTLALRITASPAGAPCSDTYEPDDDAFATTAVIKDGETQHRNFCDDSSDWLRFMACGGHEYTIQTTNLGDQTDTFLEIYSYGLSLLASDDDGNGGLASRIVWAAPTTGIYLLRVRQIDNSYGVDREYDLLLNGPTTACDLWTYTAGGAQWDEGVALIERQDGRVLATGRTESYSSTNADAWFLAVAMNGMSSDKRLWVGSGDDTPRAIAQDPTGKFLIVGDSNSFSAQARDSLVVFYGYDGNYNYAHLLVGGTSDDYSNAIAVLAGGSYVVAGSSSSGAGGLDGWMYGVGPNFVVNWIQTIGGSGNEELYSVLANANGDFTVTGYTTSYGAGQKDGLVARLDSSGNLLWSRAVGTTASDEFRKAFETPDGGVLLLGTTTGSTFVAAANVWLVKLDATGQVLWEKTIGGGGDDRVLGGLAVSDGYVIAGYTDSAAVGNYDGMLMKVNASGDLLWIRTYGGNGTDRVYDVIEVLDGSLVAAGYTKSFGAGLADAWLLKVAPDGVNGAFCASTTPPQMALQPRSSTATDPNLSAVAMTSAVVSYVGQGIGYFSTSESLQCHVVPPTEVSAPTSPTPLLFTSHDDLLWEDAAFSHAQFFNLYRDDVALLPLGGYGSCLGTLPTNAYSDSDVPDPGVAWFYLVTARNGLGEGTMGKDSQGNERPNENPCP